MRSCRELKSLHVITPSIGFRRSDPKASWDEVLLLLHSVPPTLSHLHITVVMSDFSEARGHSRDEHGLVMRIDWPSLLRAIRPCIGGLKSLSIELQFSESYSRPYRMRPDVYQQDECSERIMHTLSSGLPPRVLHVYSNLM